MWNKLKEIDQNIENLFVVDDIEYSLYDDDNGIAFNPRNHAVCRLSSVHHGILKNCDRMRTVDQHVDDIFSKNRNIGLQRAEVREVLLDMKAKGMMLCPADVLANLEVEASELEQLKTQQQTWKKQEWNLAVGSADRPELLGRMLKTASTYVQELEVKPLFVMVDDSRSSKNRALNKQIAREFSETCGLKYEYWDRDSRILFCRNLTEQLPQCESSINYLLSPSAHQADVNTIGQVRNMILLRSVGRPLLMLDDDCLINPVSDSDYSESGVKLAYSGRNAAVCKSSDELISELKKIPLNPFEKHLDILGTSVVDICIKKRNELLNIKCWEGIRNRDLFDLNGSDVVGMSINGIAGALNLRQMNWVFKLEGEQQQQAMALLDSTPPGSSFEQASWVGANLDELGKSINFIGTTICGITAMPLLPPLLPVGRNEDIALGITIELMYPQAQAYMFGWGLPHTPEPRRYWQPLEGQSAPPFGVNPICMRLIRKLSESCPFVDPGKRLDFLASGLKNTIGKHGVEHIKWASLGFHSSEINLYETSSRTGNNSSAYQHGCKQMQNYHAEKMAGLDENLPDLLTEFESMASNFSRALYDWPEIWKLCEKPELLP